MVILAINCLVTDVTWISALKSYLLLSRPIALFPPWSPCRVLHQILLKWTPLGLHENIYGPLVPKLLIFSFGNFSLVFFQNSQPTINRISIVQKFDSIPNRRDLILVLLKSTQEKSPCQPVVNKSTVWLPPSPAVTFQEI